MLEGGEVGGEGGEEVGAFRQNGFLRFEFVEELVDPRRHWRVLRLLSQTEIENRARRAPPYHTSVGPRPIRHAQIHVEEDGRSDVAMVHGVKAEGVSIAVRRDSGGDGGGSGPSLAGGRGNGERKRETNEKRNKKQHRFCFLKIKKKNLCVISLSQRVYMVTHVTMPMCLINGHVSS